MADLIEHCGVVERTERDTVYVRITSRSACGTCKARQACGLAEAQDKIVAVATPAIAGVGVYYFALWLFRRKIEHTIQFTITKI